MPIANFKVREMLYKRTPNSKTWMNSDGSFTTEIFSTPMHFEDQHGNLQNINTDLYDEADFDRIDEPVAAEGAERFKQAKTEAKAAKKQDVLNRSQHNFQALRVPFDAHIPRNFQRGYTIGKEQDKLTFKPVKASPSMGELSQSDRSIIVYQDVWNDTDVELQVQPTGLKETIHLKTSKAPTSFAFEVKGKDIADDFTAGTLKLMPAWLIDAGGTKRDVEQKIVRSNDNKMYVELVADVTELVYPIAIDPTVIIQPLPSESMDTTWIYEYRTPETTTLDGDGNGGNLELGRLYTNIYVSGMKFDLSGLPRNAEILSGKLSFRVYYAGSTTVTANILAYPIISDWTETSPAMPLYDGAVYNNITLKNTATTLSTFDISNVAKYWNENENRGILLYAPPDIPSDSYKAIYSSDHSSLGSVPQLSITYNEAPSIPNILSPNGGENWNALHKIQWEPSTDDTALNLQYQIDLSTDGGDTWKVLKALTDPGATSFDYDFTNEPETSMASISIRAYDGSIYSEWDESSGVFTIVHNQAPGAPTNLAPAGGLVKDRALPVRLSWLHNDPNAADPQSKYDLQWRKKGATVWTTVSQVSTNQFHDLTGLAHGEHEWRVRTYDQAGLSSAYSDIALFLAGDKPATATIVSPANQAVIAVPNPTVQWSSVAQAVYKLAVKDAAGAIIWTDEKASTNKAVTIGANLENGKAYTLELSIKNVDDLWSNATQITFNISYTPPPVPTISAAGKNDHNEIVISNPAPSGTQPSVTHNHLFKRIDEVWIRIAAFLPMNGSYKDYAIRSGQPTEYRVQAWGDNGTLVESAAAAASIELKGVYLHSVLDPAGTVHHYQFDGGGRSSNREKEHQYLQFAGRKKKVIEYGESMDYGVSVGVKIRQDDLGAERLEEFTEGVETICYRDGRGRMLFGAITAAPLSDTNFGWQTTIDVTETDYSEEV